MSASLLPAAGSVVGWLEFNVPFQHKYGYIRDDAGSVHGWLSCCGRCDVDGGEGHGLHRSSTGDDRCCHGDRDSVVSVRVVCGHGRSPTPKVSHLAHSEVIRRSQSTCCRVKCMSSVATDSGTMAGL